MKFLKSLTRPKKDALFAAGCMASLWFIAYMTDAYDHISHFLDTHEDLELDEIMLAFLAVGIGGYIYAVRRLWDLRREANARQVAESKARWIAYHDHLTKLPNRRFLEERAPTIIGRLFEKKGYTVYAIDLDGFKKVNDLIGHGGGDALLVQMADRLTDLFHDGLVFRLGGDEFLAIDRRRDEADREAFNSEVLRTLTTPMLIDNSHAEVGACIGYASYPDQGKGLKELSQYADMALYAAKRNGRNNARCYEEELKIEMVQRAETEARLRRALLEKEIAPYYQPLIDLETGQVRGFEALARWQASEDGFISPDIFISMAEDIGLIMDLTEHLLVRACTDATKWPSDIQLAVNLSPRMMVDRLLGMRIIKVLGDTGLAPHRLEIEITENAFIADLDLAKTVITDLRSAGIRVVLDDFGTGYSSLSQLSNLFFDKIKIDKSFVATFQTDDKQMNIVRTVVALGKGLGIAITAEGIEEQAQLEALKKLGCRYGQGFLIGKALPPEDVSAFLQERGSLSPSTADESLKSSSGSS